MWSRAQPVRVAPLGAVVPLVVVAHALDDVGEERDRLEDLGADLRVALDLLVLLRGQPIGLGDHVVADADLADVVEQPRDVDALDQLARQADLARDLRGVDADALGVAAGVGVLRVDRLGEGADGLDVRGAQLVVLLGELLGALAHLVLEVPVHVLELEVLLARHLVQALDLFLQVEVVEGLAQRRLQLLVVPGLRDQPEDLAAVDGLDGDVHLGVAGQHHAHDVGVALAHRGQQVDAAHLGHALVAHHHLHRGGVEQLEGLLGTPGAEHLPRLVAQQALHRLQDVDLVVDEQDGVAMHGAPPGRCARASLFKRCAKAPAFGTSRVETAR